MASGLLTNLSSSSVMRSRTPNWLSTRPEEVRVNEVAGPTRGACCTICVTCCTIVGMRVAKKPATASVRRGHGHEDAGGPGDLPALQPAHHRVQAEGDEQGRHDPQEQLGGVGADPVDQQRHAHADRAHESHVQRVLGGHAGTGGAERAASPVPASSCSELVGRMLRRQLEAEPRLGAGEWLAQAPGHGDQRCRRSAARLRLGGMASAGARVPGAGVLGVLPCPGGGRIRVFSHCVEAFISGAVAPRSRAGCDDHRKHYQQACQRAGGGDPTGVPGSGGRPCRRSGLSVTKWLLLKLSVR